MSRTLEITVLSGEDLRIDGKSIKKNAFAVVKIDPFNYKKTKIDEEGGSYPSWNEKLEIDMPMMNNRNAPFIFLEVGCKTYSGEKAIGYARIPVSDFMGGYTPEGYLHFLSYRLRDPRGIKNGIINVSVRVVSVSKTTSLGMEEDKKKKVSDYGCSSQASGLGLQRGSFGGVVTGVPVNWYAYPTRV